MTTRPESEALELPEPARTIFSRTRAILDAFITPHTPQRSGWKIGGGTILAARWRHRESQDIDLLVHDIRWRLVSWESKCKYNPFIYSGLWNMKPRAYHVRYHLPRVRFAVSMRPAC